MIECCVSDLCAATQATCCAGDVSTSITGVTIDSRTVGAHTLFVAFPGERVDGNEFTIQALESGAGAVAMTREPSAEMCALARDCGAALLRIADDDATEFLLRLAAWWRLQQDWCVVGITGSVGKTTTKDLLAAALATRYRVHATSGNFNNLIGVPLTLLSAPRDSEVLVVEMGMNHPGEITRLATVARPRMAIITNVGISHVGLLGSRENIARAKGEIVSPLTDAPTSTVSVTPRLFMMADNEYTPFILQHFVQKTPVAVTLVGSGAHSALRATNVTLNDDVCPSFDVEALESLGTMAAGDTLHETLVRRGAQVVPDFLLAFAAALELGVDKDSAAKALAACEATHMRQEVITGACGCRIIDDSYNASPDAVAAALNVLCRMKRSAQGRYLAVLGEMGELGNEENQLHGLVGAFAAAKPLDVLVIVGTQRADAMARAALLMGFSEDKLIRVADVEELTRVVSPLLAPDDVVLVKASRAAHLDLFVKAVRG